MIDLKRLRDDAEYRRGIERKRVRAELIPLVLRLDEQRRALARAVDDLRARQNAASKDIGRAAPDERPAKIDAAARLKEELTEREKRLAALDAELRDAALQVPNPADASVPDGGEDEGEVVKVAGVTPPAPALDHAAFGRSRLSAESAWPILKSWSVLRARNRLPLFRSAL